MLKADLEKKLAEEREKNNNLLEALTKSLNEYVKLEKDQFSLKNLVAKLDREIADLKDRECAQYNEAVKARKECIRLEMCLKESEANAEDCNIELGEQREVFQKALESIRTTALLANDALSLPELD